jgi:putative transposase
MTSTRYQNIYIDGAVCFWTSSIMDWLPVLGSKTARKAVLKILDELRQHRNVKLVGYVLMPDHVHLAVWSERAGDTQRFLKQFLSLSASEIVSLAAAASERGNPKATKWLQRFRDRARQRAKVRVWKEGGRGFPVTEPDGLRQKLDYIHQNPVRRGLVERAEDWEFSSAAWYAGLPSLISIDEIDW